ncbi:MAG: hypothetical protein VR73_05245 [Gammaproteobacteria bacterium BRH_c0]|nr:MAG: hypothetical protein VR73_05245 [Gammaproteobacteria bacterium BRH_c0]
MSTETNKRIVRQLLQDISDWNIPAIMDSLADDATWWVAGNLPGSGTFSKQQMGEVFQLMSTTLMPDGLNITLDHAVAEGDFVAAEGHSDARLPNGQSYSNQYHWVFELRDGKVLRAREYLDTHLMKETAESMAG